MRDYRDMTIPLPSGKVVTVRTPFPFEADDFELFRTLMDKWLDYMQESYCHDEALESKGQPDASQEGK